MNGAKTATAPEPDVARALEALGLRARGWAPVTALGGGTQRVSYRVVLEDGRTVKVRRVLDDARSAEALRLRTGLALPGLPPLLAHRGPVWVEAWIEGRAPSADPPHPRHLEQAAGLLATLHRVERLGDVPLRGRCETAPWRHLSEERIDALAGAGALDACAAEALRTALWRDDPGLAASGLTHGDLAPDNLIVDAAGRLHLVDNEVLGSGPLDLDLATTWCRWPMPAAAFEGFARAYAQRAGRHPGPLGWWRIVAATKSAAVRIAHYPASAAPAIARLEALARSLRDSGPADGVRT